MTSYRLREALIPLTATDSTGAELRCLSTVSVLALLLSGGAGNREDAGDSATPPIATMISAAAAPTVGAAPPWS